MPETPWLLPAKLAKRMPGPVEGLILLAAVFLAVPVQALYPSHGLDPSWMAALNVTREHQLRFGPDLLYTYGPWGALDYPEAVSRFWLVLGTGFDIVAVAAGWVVFHRALRTLVTSPVAAALAAWLVVLAVASTTPSALLVSVGGLGALYFVAFPGSARRPSLPAALGCCAALLTQLKFSEGVALALAALGCAGFAPERRWLRPSPRCWSRRCWHGWSRDSDYPICPIG